MGGIETGRVLRIQRLSTEDGPGIRSTAFLKGCGLSCRWCHNPESLSFAPQVEWLGVGCLGCGSCAAACPRGAIRQSLEGITVDQGSCDGCGNCVEECPTGAMEALGTDWSAAALAAELDKDRAYFASSGGGITLSGGEAALQPDFSREVLRLAKERGLHTALDTCGHVPTEALESLLPFVDLVLYDIKIMDPDRHRKFTGADNNLVRSNAVITSEWVAAAQAADDGESAAGPKAMWIRTPVIPGATDDDENLQAIGRFVAEGLNSRPDRWELCAFNNLCRDKYTRLGMDWDFTDTPIPTGSEMENALAAATGSELDESKITWSGTTRDEERRTDETESSIH